VHEGEVVRGPVPRARLVEVEQGDEVPLLDAGGHHRLAALEVLDVEAVVAEAEHAGEALDAGRVPVPLNGDVSATGTMVL
jgi:hypothetical protein